MKNKKILTKQNINWHIIDEILTMFTSYDVYKEDGEFEKLLNALLNYVDKKLTLPCDGEIIDSYVLVVQRPANT